jgi:glycine cleavage system H protein
MDEVPDDRRYATTHEWALPTSEGVRVGVSRFAQEELGDVVFVELPAVGEELDRETEFGVVESIKAVSDLYMPVSGTVKAINDRLVDTPELVNEAPYGEGWMLELDPDEAIEAELDQLLSAAAYREQVE